MSSKQETTSSDGHDDGHGDGHGDHPAFLAHHFETPKQQYESGKLGMWVFLGTEILMFGGLFCAYSVYRHNHPLVFEFGATHYLNKLLGGMNTIVLITSSLTMAWGVRCAQLGYQRGLKICLMLTLLGAFGFMGIKAIEYKAKWEHHVFIGKTNVFNAESQDEHKAEIKEVFEEYGSAPSAATQPVHHPMLNAYYDDPRKGTSDAAQNVAMYPEVVGLSSKQMEIRAGRVAPGIPVEVEKTSDEVTAQELQKSNELALTSTFFSVYFLMTGLHGLHVLIGIGLITWILIRASKKEFSPAYYTPVDLVGLYWHLVDLIWIFLFPLLYLIK